jgi:hypothetical protein
VRRDAQAILNGDAALMAWLVDTQKFGLTFVQGEAGMGARPSTPPPASAIGTAVTSTASNTIAACAC